MIVVLAAIGLSAQLQAQADTFRARVPLVSPSRTAMAIRAAAAPVIDGRDDDPVWQTAPEITEFREWQPTEDRPPRLPTSVRIAYDAANLYIFMRAFDPHPDSIITVLARRDSWTPSDRMGVIIDSYHDKRTGYEFFVNPSGVKVDQAMYNDGNEDNAWDAVWDVSTRTDSLGWTAEFRIPLSQLRYGQERDHTFGIVLMRDIYRYSERTSWPVLRQSQAGAMSQAGDLTGLDNLEAPRRLEASPYLVTKNVTTTSFGREQQATIGADIKYRVAPNLTLDATVNPDFGQVEADPSAYNLTTVETYFGERRPFFVAGAGLFRFDVGCTAVNDCNTGEGLFYSRRIGRTPILWSDGVYGDGSAQNPTTIISAAKLTGRLSNGLAIGAVDAYTSRATASLTGDTTLEPATNFAAVRLRQDLRGGESQVGGMLTAVNRSIDQFSSAYLHRAAYAGAVDFRHRFPGRMFELSGSLAASRVEGSAAAILATQESYVHNYQRTDGSLRVDSAATMLDGTSAELRFGKVAGQHLLFQSDLQRRSAGFDINDVGYLRRADELTWSTWAGYFDRNVRHFYQRFQWNNNWWMYWTAEGLPRERAYNTNTHINLKGSNIGLHLGGTLGQLGEVYDDHAARGGPAVRQSAYIAPWGGINGDDRKWIVPYMWVNYFRGDEGRSTSLNLSPEIDFRIQTRFTAIISPSWSHNVNDTQWRANVTDSAGQTHYVFGRLDQRVASLTLRLNYTITPEMTLQLYGSPFMTWGHYTDVKQLSATPGAARYADRYAPVDSTNATIMNALDPGFNFKALNTNVVFRWEYRPGSTLFVVWGSGRVQGLSNEGPTTVGRNLGDLFQLHGRNTFLVKMAYWFNR